MASFPTVALNCNKRDIPSGRSEDLFTASDNFPNLGAPARLPALFHYPDRLGFFTTNALTRRSASEI